MKETKNLRKPILNKNRISLNETSLFSPTEEDSPVENRNKRIARIERIFQSTPEWTEACEKALQQNEQTGSSSPVTIDSLVDLLRKNPRHKFSNEKALSDFLFSFQQQLTNFPSKRMNEMGPENKCTILYAACRSGWLEVVFILCSHPNVSADGIQCISSFDQTQSTCLHGANWGGHPDVVAYLLAYKEVKPISNIRSNGQLAGLPSEEMNDEISETTQTELETIWSLFSQQKLKEIQKFVPDSLFLRVKIVSRLDKEIIDFRLSEKKNIIDCQYGKGDDSDECVPSGDSNNSLNESSTFSINNRFQEVASKFIALNNRNEIPETLSDLNMQFVEVSRDFLYFAKTISKVIISEVYLPNDKKTIQPKDIGGTIGGDKYVVQAVLFKFAKENEGKLTMQMASKISGHELKSLSHLWECKIKDVFLPLQCSIDYLGFRMIAMLLLPLDKTTLKVGSSDGCETYHDDSPELLEIFKDIGEALNLAPHPFQGHTLYGPFDLEGHIGTDGKKYIIDFSRLFPPVPSDNYPSGILYRLFRPEFVKCYSKSLCSDGFMKSVIDNEQFNNDLREAEKHLRETTIPQFCVFLQNFVPVVLKLKMVVPGHLEFRMSRTLHEYGINVRYMGLVYYHCKTDKVRALLLIEMAARVIKQVLREKIREKMKQEKVPVEHPYIRLLVRYLNTALFSETEESNQSWKDIQQTILKYFEMDYSTHPDFSHLSDPLGIRKIIWEFVTDENNLVPKEGPHLLFDRIRQMMGFKIHKSYLDKLYKGNVSLKTIAVTSVGQRIKHMNVISHAEGWLLRTDDRDLAMKKFNIARDSVPLNKYTLRNYALLYFEQNKIKKKDPNFVWYIKYLFNLALSEDTRDTHTLYQYGRVLFEIGEIALAEEYLLQAVEFHPDHQRAWLELITVLKMTVKLEIVKKIFRTVFIKFDHS